MFRQYRLTEQGQCGVVWQITIMWTLTFKSMNKNFVETFCRYIFQNKKGQTKEPEEKLTIGESSQSNSALTKTALEVEISIMAKIGVKSKTEGKHCY